MRYLIDTNIAIHLRDGDQAFVAPLRLAGAILNISLVTLIELEGGVSIDPKRTAIRRAGIDMLLRRTELVRLDRAVVDAYAAIVAHAGFSRRKILDRLIAATALVHDLDLVTTNPEDFRDIPDLRLEVWPAAQ